MLIELLTRDERSEIEGYCDGARGRHPAWSIMNAYCRSVEYERAPKDYLANEAVERIRQESGGEAWLNSALKRIAQTSDFEAAASAIAEICCYGAMLEAGVALRPIPTNKIPTPDFEFWLEGTAGVVEVTAKLEHDEQVSRARQIAEGETPTGVERSNKEAEGARLDFTIAELHPFGAPNPDKPGDTTQTNAISRICSVKAKETQFADGMPSLLWIDFRHLGSCPAFLAEEQASPLICGHGGVLCSGAIWYAFFGWKDAPVFDDDVGGRQTITPMAHDGRFFARASKTSRYSAAIICLEKATILFENPVAPTPLTDIQRASFTRLPWFNLEYSVANWQSGDVDRGHALARSMIDALTKNREGA